MRGSLRILVFILLSSGGLSVAARDIAGVTIPEQVDLDGTPLVLNGAGIRSKFFVKVYVGALYLTAKEKLAASVIAATTPQRVSMHVLYDEISKEKLTGGWTDGFANNHSHAELEKLKPRLEQFNALFSGVKRGDIVNIDYLPGKGTRVMMNEQIKGMIPGDDFHQAVMKVWLGETPADHTLKAGMLGTE